MPSDSNIRERIIASAKRLFAERGFEGVTLRLIGKDVGLHNSSLMHHFGSKQEIVASALAQIADRQLAVVSRLRDDDPPTLDTFIDVMVELSDLYAEDRDIARMGMRLLLNPERFFDAQVEVEQHRPHDDKNRLVPFMTHFLEWFDCAKRADVIRKVEPFQATRLVLGMLFLDPIWMAAADVKSRSAQKRRAELEAFLRGALAP